MKSWTEISQHALLANYHALQQVAGSDTSVLAVVKANAYGHGLALCAPVLAAGGAPWLGVTDFQEAFTARQALSAAGIPDRRQPRILIMSGPLPADAADIVHHNFACTVWTPDQLAWLGDALLRRPNSSPVDIHLEIDTGMSRQGAQPGPELTELLDALRPHPLLRVSGVFTHFASSEVVNSPQTAAQRTRFEAAMTQIAAANLQPTWIHAGNSSTHDLADAVPWLHDIAARYHCRPMTRAGLALYGHCLPIEQETQPGAICHPEPTLTPNVPVPSGESEEPFFLQAQVAPHLKPVLTWKTRILAIRDVSAGATIGYNATFVAPRPMRLALLPMGYADGLRRELSAPTGQPSGWVVLHGHIAPIIGRISMNLTSIDVTEIPAAQPNDEVILLGPGITAEDHARLARTIPYEILCALRVAPRLVP